MSGARYSGGDSARRAFGFFGRGTIDKINDKPQLQELDLSLLKDERKAQVERFQSYGLSSVPLPPTGKGKARKAAEVVVAFLSGNRSHGVIVAQDDRRHRPKNLKEGESVLYDDQKQQVHLTRDGIRIRGGDKQLPVHVDVGGAHFEVTKEQILMKVGDITVKLNSQGFFCNDHKIDHTHKHTEVMPGGGKSGPPE